MFLFDVARYGGGAEPAFKLEPVEVRQNAALPYVWVPIGFSGLTEGTMYLTSSSKAGADKSFVEFVERAQVRG